VIDGGVRAGKLAGAAGNFTLTGKENLANGSFVEIAIFLTTGLGSAPAAGPCGVPEVGLGM